MQKLNVSCAIIVQGDQVFCDRRADGDLAGMWEFPGGKQKPGESGRETAIREVKEELDLDVDIIARLCNVRYQYPEYLLDMRCYICVVTEGILQLSEADRYQFLNFEDLDRMNWCPADVNLARFIQKNKVSILERVHSYYKREDSYFG